MELLALFKEGSYFVTLYYDVDSVVVITMSGISWLIKSAKICLVIIEDGFYSQYL